MQPRQTVPASPEAASFTSALLESSPNWQAATSAANSPVSSSSTGKGVWTEDEHGRFIDALKLYPHGPWKAITHHIGTRSIRQVQTHAQKYMEKVERRARGLKTAHPRLVRRDHRIDVEVEPWWKRETGMVAGSPTRSNAAGRRRQRVHSGRSSMSSTSSPAHSESKQEIGEDDSDDFDSTSESWEFEPLPLRSELAPASPLPTLEECLAVVNECLIDQVEGLHLEQSSFV